MLTHSYSSIDRVIEDIINILGNEYNGVDISSNIIIRNIIDYINNSLMPFTVNENNQFNKEIIDEINDAILKQCCVNMGELLSYTTDNETLLNLVNRLSKGV